MHGCNKYNLVCKRRRSQVDVDEEDDHVHLMVRYPSKVISTILARLKRQVLPYTWPKVPACKKLKVVYQ